ncbi:MAG: 16S rRNA (guanine(527)-N(7))-methyltransferase RsmG [Ignavibacteriales bacterium]|nr:16S rRNA (guanine(527)-N(7))-methyltransferase RsmG [Ignavibacteriales bacterium]MBI5726406.1 16S rRNA (guanine(527)-N(7))-methyltransferase RsmG [Ignavibacteriales bacterium]
MDTQEQFLKQLTSLYWENGYNPEPSQMERLAHFAELVVDKNEVINLISRKDIPSIIENHVFISSYIQNYIPEKCQRFIDIGTGGGFPGIPIAITRPLMRGVLVDSVKKKIDSVAEFVSKLRLSNVKTECSRVEDPEFIGRHKDSFDLVISRATVPLVILLRYALPLIKEKAYVLALKGGDLSDELHQAEVRYGANIKKATIYDLHYRPSNIKNIKGKKLVQIELVK